MNQFEASIILWIQENLRGPMDAVVKFITYLGDDGILWIAMGIVLLFWKKTRPIGITVLISLLFDFVVNELITPLVTNVSPYRSFPSGHSGGSFSAMFALYKWVPKKIGIPALILATMVALSRLYVGVHYPTDIIAGCIIGFICSVLANYIVRWTMKKSEERKANA